MSSHVYPFRLLSINPIEDMENAINRSSFPSTMWQFSFAKSPANSNSPSNSPPSRCDKRLMDLAFSFSARTLPPLQYILCPVYRTLRASLSNNAIQINCTEKPTHRSTTQLVSTLPIGHTIFDPAVDQLSRHHKQTSPKANLLFCCLVDFSVNWKTKTCSNSEQNVGPILPRGSHRLDSGPQATDQARLREWRRQRTTSQPQILRKIENDTTGSRLPVWGIPAQRWE